MRNIISWNDISCHAGRFFASRLEHRANNADCKNQKTQKGIYAFIRFGVSFHLFGVFAMRPSSHESQTRTLQLLLLLAVLSCPAMPLSGQDDAKARDAWQRPQEVMNALGIKQGSVVGDIGAGGGYFTFHLAARVGPTGKAYAEDILERAVNKIRERAAKEGLAQIEAVPRTQDDPPGPAARPV